MASQFDDVSISGILSMSGPEGTRFRGGIPSSEFKQDSAVAHPVALTDLRVWDAYQTPLPGTSAADDLGLYGGTFATGSPLARTYDVKAAGAVTLYARFQCSVPARYVAGQSFTLRLYSGMVTTVADTSATVDVQAYLSDGAGSIGSDLCTTAAQSINSVVFANKDFTITPATLTAGGVLDVRIAIAVNDAATATVVIAAIGRIQALATLQG